MAVDDNVSSNDANNDADEQSLGSRRRSVKKKSHSRNRRRRVTEEPDDDSDTSDSGSNYDDESSDDSTDDSKERKRTDKEVNKKTKTVESGVRKKKTQFRSKQEKPEKIKPNKFNGKGSVESFLAQFEVCAGANRWTDSQKAVQMKCCLTEEAALLVWDSGDPGAMTYKQLIEKLQRRYGFADQQERFEVELRARCQGENESIAELYQDIKCKMIQAYPGESQSTLYQRSAKEYFLSALKDRKMAVKIREREPSDLDAAFKSALRLEALRNVDNAGTQKQHPPTAQHQMEHADVPQSCERRDSGMSRRLDQLEETTRAVLSPANVQSAQLQPNSRDDEVMRRIDQMSKEIGHLQALLSKCLLDGQFSRPLSVPTPAENTATSRVDTGPMAHRALTGQHRGWPQVVCFSCSSVDKIAKSCMCQRKTESNQAQPADDDSAVIGAVAPVIGTTKEIYASSGNQPDRRVYIRLNVNGHTLNVLLDTGSSVTLLPSSVVDNVPVEECSSRILAANGTMLRRDWQQ